jgi:hypothetical protein
VWAGCSQSMWLITWQTARRNEWLRGARPGLTATAVWGITLVKRP